MQDYSAKIDVLNKIIQMMTGHTLGGLKKKGGDPAVASVEVKAEKPADMAMAEDAGKPEEGESDDDLKSLADMYGKDDDEDDEFKKAKQPIQIIGTN